MKKLIIPLIYLFIVSCSTDSDVTTTDLNEESETSLLTINSVSLNIDEHSQEGTAIGIISATQANDTQLSFEIDTESGLEINETTGELSVGANTVLDFEASSTLPFTVSAFNGVDLVEKQFELLINDVNEYDLLTDDQKEEIDYFIYLTLWKSPTHNDLINNTRWTEPMKIFLDGATETLEINIEEVIEEYNEIFENSDFNITIVDTKEASNAHVFFGETAEVESLWEDMFEIINGKTYSGYAMTNELNAVLSNSRIWLSSTSKVLFKHELGHALGFGHSERCEIEKSFLCSNISNDHDFLEIEKGIIRLAYKNETEAGLTEDEIKLYLANTLILEQ
ncbi:hypothetical protein [Maribacter sp. Asnod1-A12]|uniref:hypothetical protein n=1 Tax=Maribacter sp. Asnod1-A12 TaxID=3160576 RepID=UPI00386FA9F8